MIMDIRGKKHRCRVRIKNPLGFHVRPVQRFAELARIFESDIKVEIEGRKASGKSVMGLMSLGGRCGATMKIQARGKDAKQAINTIKYLVNEDFFVEDDIGPGERPRRHIERLKHFMSCFDSDVKVLINGREIEINSPDDFDSLDFGPTSDIDFAVSGSDAPQARQVLKNLVNYRFYIEDAMNESSG